MNNVTVAVVNQFERFNGVVLKHIQETEISNVVGFVFHKDRSNNRFVTIAFSDDTEKVYNVDDLAYIAVDDSETDGTEIGSVNLRKYTLDEIASEICDDLNLGRLTYNDIKDGTVYAFLKSYFPDAPMLLCYKAVMKVLENMPDVDHSINQDKED